MPVAFHRLNNPKRDGIWVALAGPGANVILAYVSALAFHALFFLLAQDVVAADVIMWIGDNLQSSMKINILLAVFNMLPIPPLDGGRVMLGLLPDRYARGFARLQRYELLIVMALLVTLLLAGEPLFRVISPIVNALYVLLWDLAGLP